MRRLDVFSQTVIATLLTMGVWTTWGEVYFGHGWVPGGGRCTDSCSRFDGRFFATTDYGFTLGGEEQLSASKLGLKWNNRCPYVRGQDPASVSRLGKDFYGNPWLSDGGDCVFGLACDKPFTPKWEALQNGRNQFDRMPNKTPRFDQAVIYWGRLVPKPGTWGACVLDAEGNFKRIEVDNRQPLYPYDQSTLRFSPTTVKKLYCGLQGGADGAKDNFVEVRSINLLLHNEPLLDNSLFVDQTDAYRVFYSDRPGTIEMLQVMNFYFDGGRNPNLLQDLSPFVEVSGKRLYAEPNGQTVKTEKNGRTDTLRYPLVFKLPDGQTVNVEATAVFGIKLKETVYFAFKAQELPKDARLGFEMSGHVDLFGDCSNVASPIAMQGRGQTLRTPAGPVGVSLEGTECFRATRINDRVLFDVLAEREKLAVSLSLPIGPEAGLQPGSLNYSWRSSLSGEGAEELAPFVRQDLELQETINLGDPNDPHAVYDITNDPLIDTWRKSGSDQLPRSYGSLNYIHNPEVAKVPLTKVLGQLCRVIGTNETTYFRFNLKTKIEPQVPYLLVVEHAFDKERRGEFHCIGVNPDGTDLANDRSVGLCPFGGFDTGKGPQPGRFQKESVFLYQRNAWPRNITTTISLCFSNTRWSAYFKNFDQNPEGLAIRSVSLYRIKRLPELPDLTPLLPKGIRRHVTFDTEGTSPWDLTQFSRLCGCDSFWTHRQMGSEGLYGSGGLNHPRPGWQRWIHAASLDANRWLYEKAARDGVAVKTTLGWLIDLGFEGTDYDSFLGVGWLPGPIWGSIPLSPTQEEKAHLGRALDRSLSALAKYPSFTDISMGDVPSFGKRDLDDFAKETGIAFASSPAYEENLKRLLESPKETRDAWMKWSCQKRFEFLSWLLNKARSYRSDIYLTINQSWYFNGLQGCFYGDQWLFDTAQLQEKGITTYDAFLKFVALDPALYRSSDGFVFAVEMEPKFCMPGRGHWPFEGSGDKILAGFGGGLSVSSCFWDERPKSLLGWGCTCMKDRRSFRKEFLEAVHNANAREYVFQTYTDDPCRGRLDDLRELAVPFRLLPFVSPEPYAGTLADAAQQAVIKRYGNRHGLMNLGDRPTDVVLTLPQGTRYLIDLSSGVRQELVVDNKTVTLHLKPWSLKTLEIR